MLKRTANFGRQREHLPRPAEKRCDRTEANLKLPYSETPQTNHFLEANSNVPLAGGFKPQVKLLSRKPMIAKRDPVTGMASMSLDDDEDENATANKQPQLSPEEIRAKQKRDREEKQRRYEEARAKIFGESAPSSGESSPGTVTPPRSDGQQTPRGRGRGRGGSRGNPYGGNDGRKFDARRMHNASISGRELYDPGYAARPEPSFGRGSDSPARMSTPRNDQQPAIRAPRGPDGSGRGFRGARRGSKEP